MSEESKVKRRKAVEAGEQAKAPKKARPMKGISCDHEMIALDKLIPYEANPKKHPPEQVEKVARSIAEFGFDQPIVVGTDMVIIKGHGRRLASIKLGLTEVPVIIRDDLSENEEKASRIADNQTAESYWQIGNLLAELEALHESEYDLTSTGYDLDEVRSLYPGLIETDADFQLSGSEGGIVTGTFESGADGRVGSPVVGKGEKKKAKEWVKLHDTVIVPFSGDRHGLAALLWCLGSGVEKKNLVIIDTNFGQRNWSFHDQYLKYIEDKFDVTIHRSENRLEEWLQEIKDKGFPTKEKPWCCSRYRMKAVEEMAASKENTVVVFGTLNDGEVEYREIGMLSSLGDYAAPFSVMDDAAITKVIETAGAQLNPLYKVTDKYLCPMCPMYERPDHVFLKEFDLDLWIRWMVYLGKSQYCEEFTSAGHFNELCIQFIGDGIEAREYGSYREFAQPIEKPSQPVREVIIPGDDYGWDREADKIDPRRIDKPQGKWWNEEGHSKAYEKQDAQLQADKKERGDMPLEDWLAIQIPKAKKLAQEEGLE